MLTPRASRNIALRLLLLAAGLVMSLAAESAAIGVESVSYGGGSGSSITVPHTVTGTDRLLLVSVHLENAAAVGSVTWGGQPLTLKSSRTHSGGKPKVQLWYLVAPTEGSANVVVTLGSADQIAVGAYTLTGVDQDNSIYSSTSEEGTNGDPAVVVTSRAGDLVLDFLASTSTGVPTVGSNQTVILSQMMGSSGHYGAASREAGSNAVEMRWLLDQGTKPWVLLGVSIAPSYYSYYVSPTGNDGADGLTPGTAWATIDNGEDRGVLGPGDTINVLAGTYGTTSDVKLVTGGTAERRIVYRGVGSVVVDGLDNDVTAFAVDAPYITVDGFEITNTKGEGVYILDSATTVSNCFIHTASGSECVYVKGPNALIYRNVLVAGNFHGISVLKEGTQTLIYNNVIYGCSENGIEFESGSITSRIFNNIIVLNNKGISAPSSGNVIGYNDVYDNNACDYCSNAVDSAGGISVEPWFVDSDNGDFNLQIGSQCIDAGLDLGYEYRGAAPDMGAIEVGSNYLPTLDSIGPRTTTEHVTLTFGISASDAESTPELSTSTRHSGAAFTDHGNGTGTLTWTPGYPTAGEYAITFYATDDSLAVDSERVVVTINPAVLDYVTVSPDLTSVSADGGRQFTVAGFDGSGNRADSGVITWSLTNALGTIDAAGWFDATTTGTTKVVATSHLGPSDTTTLLQITPGVLASLDILSLSDTVSADSTMQFSAWGMDADGNAVTELGTITWSVLGGIGTIDASGLFTATTAGYGFIQAVSNLGPEVLSDSILVVPGVLHRYSVVPDVDVVEEGTTQQFAAYGYDYDNNLVAVLTDSSAWSTTDPTGSIDGAGLYTAGNTLSPPDYYVKGVYGIQADSSTVTVISNGQLDHIRVEYADGSEAVDTSLSTDNDTTLFRCFAYDSGDNPIGAVDVTWGLIGDTIGTLESESEGQVQLELTRPGAARLVAQHAGGSADTSGIITVVSGLPDHLYVTPNTATVSTDSTLLFTCESLDADGNVSIPAVIPVFSVLGGIGEIDSLSGLFTPLVVGNGHIAAAGGGLVDTTGAIKVVAGALVGLQVEPDSVKVGLGDEVQFTVTGRDAAGNGRSVGDVVWKLLGRNGYIDADGLFEATRAGIARVAATSDLNVADTTELLAVEEVVLTTIPVGNMTVVPAAESESLFSFRLDNFFEEPKALTGVKAHLVISGPGLEAQRLTNVDSIMLYLDDDDDSLLSGGDLLLASAEVGSDPIELTFAPVQLPVDEERVFLISAAVSETPRDGDTLDIFIYPATDISLEDATLVAGPDSANCYGRTRIDGMVASQLTVTANGSVTMSPGDAPVAALTIDLPRNGYASDILTAFSVTNTGTAIASDLAALTLLRDDGSGTFDGYDAETFVGDLVYTGDHWTISGLNVPLNDPANRFFLTVELSSYPVSGHQFVTSVPLYGITVASGNDGPSDAAVIAADTITVQTSEKVSATAYALTAQPLIPGEVSEPLLAFSLVNDYAAPIGIDSLRVDLTWATLVGASVDVLNSQLDSLLLYLDGGTYSIREDADVLLATALVSDGRALFRLSGVDLPQRGGEVSLAVVAAVDEVNPRNGNRLSLTVDEDGLHFAQPVSLNAEFPLANVATHPVDIFPAALVATHDIAAPEVQAGGVNKVLFDFHLPGNGYAADSLSALWIENLGTVLDAVALTAVRIWADAGDDGFDGDEILVGQMALDAGGWSVRNLKYPIPIGGRRFVITADVAAIQFESGTVQFAIPVDGCLYRSGADGPDDVAVVCPDETRIYPANRITAISIPRGSIPLAPGSEENNLLTFALYNGYGSATQTLQGLTIANASHSRSTSAFADHELGQVSLLFDADKDRMLDNDSLAASGYFSDGALHFSGIDIVLQPESLSYFFVVANVPLNLIDSDSLAAIIEAPSSFTFSQAVVVNGDLPLSAGGYLVADGSVARQYSVLELESGTLSPGDLAVPLFAFSPAINGDQNDRLQSLTVANVGDADSSDLSALYLWYDRNEDRTWQDTDSLLGAFDYIGGQWTVPGLDHEIAADSVVLFVTGDVSPDATPGVTFRAIVPLNGCTFASANDGPIDEPLVSDYGFAVSSSGLGISYTPLAGTYTLGQSIPVRFTVTNRLATVMDEVSGVVVGCTDSTIVTRDSAYAGPGVLDPGESIQFAGYFTAIAPGRVAFQVQGMAWPDADTSALLATNQTCLQQPPADIPVSLISSIPTAVTRGQTNVFPLSISYSHPGADSSTAAIRLDSLRLDVFDGLSQPLQASALFSRMVLSTGYTPLTVLNQPPAEAAVWMVFNEPVIVQPGGSPNLSLLVDIDSLATAQGFTLSILDASALGFVDANSLQPVSIDPGVVFPLSTPVCRVEDRSQQMAISYTSLVGPTVNRGQDFVDVLRLHLRHPGEAGSSQIQLTNLSFRLLDYAGAPLPVSELLEYARLMKRQTVIAEVDCSEVDTSDIAMQLNSPVSLNPGEIDSVRISLTLKSVIDQQGFSLYIEDSLAFTVRELSSGLALDAATDTALWATGSVFPVQSSIAELKEPAGDLVLCLTTSLPVSTVGGRDSLELLHLDCAYPVSDDYSSLSLRRVLMSVMDSTGAPINPVDLFDRIGMVDPTGALTYQSFIPLEGGAAVFDIGTDGWEIGPGDSVEMRLVADISIGTEVTNFALMLENIMAIELIDATDTTHHPWISNPPLCAISYPFVSTVTSVYLPAGRPGLIEGSRSVVIAPRAGRGVSVYHAALEYDSPLLQGAVELDALSGRVFRRTSAGLVPARESDVFSSLKLTIDGDTLALDSDLNDDTVALALTVPLIIEHGEAPTIGLVADINPAATLGNYVIRFEDSTFVEMVDRNLTTAVYPTLSGGYPVFSPEISVVADGLEASFTNYPNPFIPGEGATTIGFVLDEDAHIDIELFTITGELIETLVVDEFRSAGAHQSDTWNGRNESGCDVAPGTYYCRITARYHTGRTESVRRKVAVLR